MEIKTIEDKNAWESFMSEAKPRTFLHSWNWAEFYHGMGHKIFRLGVYNSGELAALALFIKVEARRGVFLLCPHGPILKIGLASKAGLILEVLLEYLKALAGQEHCSYIRICPLLKQTEENEKLFLRAGFRQAPIHLHPELTWVLDISPTTEELLKNMRKTTRYSIKKAERDGVEIIKSSDTKDLEIFWCIYQRTAKEQGFTPFNKTYLANELKYFSEDGQALFFFGKYHDEIISAALIIYYQGAGFYHQGASIKKYSQITASYLLQWQAILEAKSRGCNFYNFWGIAPDNEPHHPWAGLSLFKKGFGGFAEEYLHAKDYVLSPKYWLSFVIEKVRKAKRGL